MAEKKISVTVQFIHELAAKVMQTTGARHQTALGEYDVPGGSSGCITSVRARSIL
jgi:hypothetical protein